MSWDEPLTIAERLAASLGAEVCRWPARASTGAVLLMQAEQLDDVPAVRLRSAAAAVVTGASADASSAALVALAERVESRGLSVALATFAASASAEVPLVVATAAGDARVAELLAAGPHALTLDAAVGAASASADDPAARVCVVSFEASGMTGGGIGTASSSLAETLARAGHDVTLLFSGWQEAGAEDANARWAEHYAQRDVHLEILRPPGGGSVKNPHFPARSAYEVYCWLRAQQPFDVVHLPENMGHGAYAQLAKRHGAAFARTTFVVGTHGPTRWAAEANRVALTREEFLVNEQLERISVELADVLLGPSRYLHGYMRERGWALPERVHVQPYATPSAVRPGAATVPRSVRARRETAVGVVAPGHAAVGDALALPDELVFFGRIETRKGVVTLCDALDLLAAHDELPAFSVTFLGPVSEVLGQSADAYIAARAAQWPWGWRIVSDRDQRGAAEYLARPGVMAVMPSTVDNAPNTVSEAIALGVPFVAARAGGTGELIAAEQRDDHMFGATGDGPPLPVPLTQPTPMVDPAPLAALLLRRLTTAVTPARPPATLEAVDAAYDRWHRAVARTNREAGATSADGSDSAGAAGPDAAGTGARAASVPDAPSAGADSENGALPTLAVCVLFDGDEALLRGQLESLTGIDGVDVVVADLRPADATRLPAVVGDTTVVRPARAGHAADARAAALAASDAPLVAFVPADDVPLPRFAGELRRAAAATSADVYACAVLDGLGSRDATAADAAFHAFVPLPGPPLAGLGGAVFTAGPYAIRRAALDRLGGFAADAAAQEADDELLNRAAAAGLRLEVLPEPLALKRRAGLWVNLRAQWPRVTIEPPYDAEQWLRVERPFADAAGDLPGLLRGARSDVLRLQAVVEDQRDAYERRVAEQRVWIDGLEVRAAQSREREEAMDAEIRSLRALNAELSQSAAQIAMRTLLKAGKRVQQRLRR
ncbi:glycosyltransferase family 4 protein [Conexibacter sp. CPCC 206217]|uniref:glycosyltransferase family 4 protein n=1 Tax=Conexibacter sp. CPCC 206217 TaxID=3064574 RepID=UPI00271FF550|nr:glycosyltransferase [Conexibacter sp. CPCC 206217]MDO8210002.1 glycosyltransferase [Conexibacter sp. CPCC 206217]